MVEAQGAGSLALAGHGNSRVLSSPSLPCSPSAPFNATADSTGTHSLYTTYQDHEIMFHVSTMLPYTPNNQQQV